VALGEGRTPPAVDLDKLQTPFDIAGLDGHSRPTSNSYQNLWFYPQTPVVKSNADLPQNFLFW
jgi:hypothetical protein